MSLLPLTLMVRSNSPASEEFIHSYVANWLITKDEEANQSSETADDSYYLLVMDNKHKKIYYTYSPKAIAQYEIGTDDIINYIKNPDLNTDQSLNDSNSSEVRNVNTSIEIPFEVDN